MEKREYIRGKEKKEYFTIKEKVVMEMFPFTKKEKTCVQEQMRNRANRAYLMKCLVGIADDQVKEFMITFEAKYK